MADISTIIVPDGTSYDLKDASAISDLSASGNTISYTKRNGTTGSISVDGGDGSLLIITEDMVTVTKTATKGVSPYNTSYYYTNITVNDLTADDLKVGLVIMPIVISTMIVSSSYRNVRIRFGEDDEWHPVMGTTAILAGSSYFTSTTYRMYCYRTDQISTGAFHVFTDSNTTYSAMSASEAATGTATSSRAMTAAVLSGYVTSRLADYVTTTDSRLDEATTSSAGIMSAEDKEKLDDLANPTTSVVQNTGGNYTLTYIFATGKETVKVEEESSGNYELVII